jgi:hypothetical protein
MQHQLVLTALEQRVRRYQESQSYEELKNGQHLDDAINKMGTVAAPQWRTMVSNAEQQNMK